MNWMKAVIAGIVGGIVFTLVSWVIHGFIMTNAYMGPEIFDVPPANPLWFFLVGICIGIAAALLFAKSRACWGAGLGGGAVFGFWLGLVLFFWPFYNPLVLNGFPYYLAWCWGGIDLILAVILGGVLGAIYKQA